MGEVLLLKKGFGEYIKKRFFYCNMINDIYEKVVFFFSKRITVHIQKNNGQFYNGLILEHSDKHLILHDRVVNDVIIFFSEITKLEPFKEKG